jgi:type IV secretion system protein VirB5
MDAKRVGGSRGRALLVAGLAMLAAVPAARAQMAVIDVRAIAQLAQQLNTMRQQLEAARAQLREAQQQSAALTGTRGMERLLAGQVRNYLPPDYAALEAALRGTRGAYAALAADVQAATDRNAVLTPAQLAALTPAERAPLEDARRSAALLEATARQALVTTSARFASLQQLIDAIASARDPKAIAELQARIAAEQGMLVNEQTKLGVLYQAAQAEEWARKQRARERALADVGSLRRLPPLGL